jgi:ribose 5-phosphate isomerase B
MFHKIYVANDHGGFSAKRAVVKYLADKGCPVEDFGSGDEKIVRYPYYAAKVARSVARNPGSGGVLICSTGIGMSIIANKFKGIRASLCTDSYMAEMTRRHNDSNVLCLGGRITGEAALLEIVGAWLAGGYEGGRHDISLGLIRQAEEALFKSEGFAFSEDRKSVV